jgi:hypothetical protein
MNLDLTDDYLVFDGRESVTAYPATAPEIGLGWTHGKSVAVADARIEKITEREYEPTAGATVRVDTRFRLPVKTAAGYVPSVGDVVVRSGGETWTVVEAGMPRFGNSYSCYCLRLEVSGGLGETLTFSPSVATNVKGSLVMTRGNSTTTAGRVQPLGEQEIIFQAQLGFDVNYKVYTAVDLPAKNGDLFVDAAGVTYEVKSSSGRQRIDTLPTYLCKRRP